LIRADLEKPGSVNIRVIDSGVAFDRVNVKDLFAPFSGGISEGTGLLVARSIIESHGGRIWAESASSGGAVFSFILPALRGSRSLESKRRG
jgi:signal transduction histidine kinase